MDTRDRSRSRSRSASLDRRATSRKSYHPRSDDEDSFPHSKRYKHDRNDRFDRHEKRRRSSSSSSSSSSFDEETEKRKIIEVHQSMAGRTGGVYIPPFKMRLIEQAIEDKTSKEYQKLTWEALKKSINGIINKVSPVNLQNIVVEAFQENLIRGRGLFCRSLMKSQSVSPKFTPVYSALVAVINTKLPEIGELLLKRLVNQFKKAYKRTQKPVLISSVTFIAHLCNHKIADVVIPLQILAVLLKTPTDDSVEIAVEIVKECGQTLSTVPRSFNGTFNIFRSILHEGTIDKRVQYMIENLFAIRKNNFADHPAIPEALDLVDEEDQFIHSLILDDEFTAEELGDRLNYFRFDPDYAENEKLWADMKSEILGDSSSYDSSETSESAEEGSDEENEDGLLITDYSNLDIQSLKRTIYLTIMSSYSFEECAHKIIKMNIPPEQDRDMCKMVVECCAQEKTYNKFFGLLAQRFCLINPTYKTLFEDDLFEEIYEMIHLYETNKIRNIAKFYSHLLHTDAISWEALMHVRLNEDDSNSSKRIFVKILFQDVVEYMGLEKINKRIDDPEYENAFSNVFPKTNPRHTRFSINFFTTIGLGGITENLRKWHDMTKEKLRERREKGLVSSSSSSTTSTDSTTSSTDSSTSSSEESSSSES
eukprot:TRINITY_DN11345_c0_g1_i1.p1 TRINITY_DN11345_c0_g1~~TRINITY_DN11345_c0_g1_i1.p1  ORF type:complete len:662 (-),score=141.90 TRINITY_DN11345_c0_g1_i1:96-2045(-)